MTADSIDLDSLAPDTINVIDQEGSFGKNNLASKHKRKGDSRNNLAVNGNTMNLG